MFDVLHIDSVLEYVHASNNENENCVFVIFSIYNFPGNTGT